MHTKIWSTSGTLGPEATDTSVVVGAFATACAEVLAAAASTGPAVTIATRAVDQAGSVWRTGGAPE